LVVDDDPLMLRVMERTFELAHFDSVCFDTVCCRSGEDAVRALATHPVSVVVSDVGMPGMNDIELLDSVRRLAPELPTILISGDGSREHQARAHGAFSYLLKPLNVEELLECVRSAIAGRC
jgi:DNA-binding NtrC family response regulator